MNLPFNLPSLTPASRAGTFVLTQDLVTAIGTIPGAVMADPLDVDGPVGLAVEFPDREGEWIILPHGTVLVVHEEGDALLATHRGGPSASFDLDRALLAKAID